MWSPHYQIRLKLRRGVKRNPAERDDAMPVDCGAAKATPPLPVAGLVSQVRDTGRAPARGRAGCTGKNVGRSRRQAIGCAAKLASMADPWRHPGAAKRATKDSLRSCCIAVASSLASGAIASPFLNARLAPCQGQVCPGQASAHVDPIIFTAVLAAAACHAGWNALLKLKAAPVVATVLVAVAAGVLVLPLLAVTPAPAPAAWPYIVASALTHIAYFVTLAEAYRWGDLTQVYPIARGTAPLLTATLASVWLNEALGSVGWAGVT